MLPNQARYTTMKMRVFRIIGAGSLILAVGSPWVCFGESYNPPDPGGYSHGSSYAHPEHFPEYATSPREYAYEPGPDSRDQEKLKHQAYLRDQEKLKHQ